MFELKANFAKMKPNFVILVPCLVILAACSSKQIQNASLEPLDLPAEETGANDYAHATPEPEGLSSAFTEATPAPVKKIKKAKKSRKHHSVAARASVRKKQAQLAKAHKPVVTAAASVSNRAFELPKIGEETLPTEPIEMEQIAPPIPVDPMIEAPPQPNWMLAAFTIAGLVALGGIAFRIRRQRNLKRGLVYN